MKEIILCKYGEIILKGANRSFFEDKLCRELRIRSKNYGSFNVSRAQSTIYIEGQNDECDIDGMYIAATKVFGIIAILRCAVAEKNMASIEETVKQYIPEQLLTKKTFKVEAKRSDKRFSLNSMQISAQIGELILELCPHIKVDVHNPDVIVNVEIRENGAYVGAGKEKAAGGMPVGTNGTALLLLSGGIDSPVAGFMIAKRGVKIEAVHFESFPYTSERAREKVFKLASEVGEYAGNINVHVVSLTHIQEEIRKNCQEDYFTLILRRFMMHIAEQIANRLDCSALVTGESVGQVASQTMKAIAVTDNIVNMPVLRPCIGLDKEEIVQIARKIGTYETSILPYEDCCTIFTPKHPKTKPVLEKVLAEEQKIDFEGLCNEALENINTVKTVPQF